MKVLLIILGAVAVLILAVVIVGYLLPVTHRATRERLLPAPPSAVFAAITTRTEFPAWRSNVTRVELLPADQGRRSYREYDGSDAITYTVDEQVPDRRLVTRISDPNLPFGGRWTFELTPEGSGTRLRITEDGEVRNPVFRFVSRFVMGHHATIDRYLHDIEARVTGPAKSPPPAH